jgi:hypothetical protein
VSNRTFLAAAATLIAACASGGPAPGESAAAGDLYRYEVPTPPTATYRLADTTTMIMGMPDGEMDMAMSSASTVELTFAADSGGVRATGTVSDYSSSMASTMLGNVDMSGVDISGDLEFVVGPLGDVEMISTPEVTGADLPTSMPFQFNAQEMFPRFPDRRLQPGDMWADTVIESLDLEALGLPVPLAGMEEDTTIYNYTLVGDTLVDGRTLRKITLSNVVSVQTSVEEAGQTMPMDMSSTLDGFILWDAERGLVVSADLVRTMDGSMSMMGMSMSMTMAGPSKLRLVN